MSRWHAVAAADALSDGQAVSAAAGGTTVLLVRSGQTIHAIADRCSHADQELACGIVRHGWIACPAHGARFDLASGDPLNPPASQPIATYRVRIADGMIEVEI